MNQSGPRFNGTALLSGMALPDCLWDRLTRLFLRWPNQIACGMTLPDCFWDGLTRFVLDGLSRLLVKWANQIANALLCGEP